MAGCYKAGWKQNFHSKHTAELPKNGNLDINEKKKWDEIHQYHSGIILRVS